ncbi:hypothetical protein [Wukongibacter sp. M2B1]|uniref:hypothetical protein n=1 Tax=Wukongibacter sp. M2B1 TaxID=3088895 RepID=UPI003D799C21
MEPKSVNREDAYNTTYHFGNTVVHIVDSKSKTPEEIEKILEEYHRVGWEIWKDILKNKGGKSS